MRIHFGCENDKFPHSISKRHEQNFFERKVKVFQKSYVSTVDDQSTISFFLYEKNPPIDENSLFDKHAYEFSPTTKKRFHYSIFVVHFYKNISFKNLNTILLQVSYNLLIQTKFDMMIFKNFFLLLCY
jgi:hypothetical protein